jgi:hypothetical protein
VSFKKMRKENYQSSTILLHHPTYNVISSDDFVTRYHFLIILGVPYHIFRVVCIFENFDKNVQIRKHRGC